MSLRLLLGGAGSGKTETILQEIVSEVQREPLGRPLWVLVPEQATFQTEQALCGRLGGIMRIRVVSFQRLAYQVMNHVAGAALTPLNEMGLTMLVRQVLGECRGQLKPFVRAARQVGFAAEVTALILQLKRQSITPQYLGEVLAANNETLPRSVADKLQDLATVYAKLQGKQHAQQLIDSEDSITWLAKHIADYGDIQGASVWMDGFAGFMPQEYAVIEKLMAMAQVSVTLTLPGEYANRNLDAPHLFFPTWSTKKKLLSLAAAGRVKLYPAVILGQQHRFAKNRALARLEQFLSRGEVENGEAEAPLGMSVVLAATHRVEVDAAAREIVRLCRDESLRYRDICLVVRDLSLYESLFTTIFADYDVPFFIDRKRAVRHHPFLNLLSAALVLIMEDYPYEAVMRCFKSGLFPISQEGIDTLDNFLLATGLRGSRYLTDAGWSFAQGELLNSLRQTVQPHIARLHAALTGGRTVRDFTQALLTLTADLQVPATLETWAQESEAKAELPMARVHAQVHGAVMAIFEQLDEILGETEMPLAEYAAILETGLESLRLGLIPPSMDQVYIVEAGRSRVPMVKVALVLGLNEGIFPARAPSPGVFSDREKERLAMIGLDLGLTLQHKVFEEQFLLYTALTRASDQLWLSYASASEGGSALLPSVELKRLLAKFPKLAVRHEALAMPKDSLSILRRIAHPRLALAALGLPLREAKAGGAISPLWWDVYGHLAVAAKWRSQARQVVEALHYTNAEHPLPIKTHHRDKARVLRSSVSRIERFKTCPFAYFAAYTLKLRERKVFKLSSADIGNFYHEALEMFHARLKAEEVPWQDLTKDLCQKISSEVAAELQPKMQSSILTSSKRQSYLGRKLQQVVERSALALSAHARQGSFVPLKVELGFGHDGLLPALEIICADGSRVQLTGRIDRLDCAKVGTRLYLRVIDFKSSRNTLTLPEIYYGLRLQLLTYLEVALRKGTSLVDEPGLVDETVSEVLPAGALYFHVHNPLLQAERPLSALEATQELLKKYRTTGMVVDELAIVKLMDGALASTASTSTLIPVRLKEQGALVWPSNDVWSVEQLSAMRAHIERLYAAVAVEILQGKIDIAPIRLDKKCACTYCEYKAVCQFDLTLEGSNYRHLPKIKPKDVWALLGVGAGEGG
ncbi:MAG: ATP-dependent helicase/deoxyribonuclease subunit B [Firmicutes bacterium]|nr:ATP-dependent helicase/deoxyribonuclease subunit B [Bacillota bacterium]